MIITDYRYYLGKQRKKATKCPNKTKRRKPGVRTSRYTNIYKIVVSRGTMTKQKAFTPFIEIYLKRLNS